jgi:glycosyltransferase involved in cell wall biosynthesis
VFIRRQVQELSALGVGFRVVSPVPFAPPVPAWSARLRNVLASSRATPASWELDGIRIDAPRYPKLPGALDYGLFGPLYYRGIRAFVHALHREWPFDLIHAQVLVPDGYAAARLGRELGVPSVATERGYLPTQLQGSRGLRASLRWTVENATQTVFVARSLAELACGLGRPARPPRVVYTGLDLERFQPGDRDAARKELGLPARAPVLLFVGHNVAKKGLYVLFEALPALWERHPDAILCVVGKDSRAAAVRAAAERGGLAERVRLVGPRPNEELPSWYAASDVVVLPSFREGLPNNLVEAAACARPIVATDTDGIPELVVDGQTGLLVPKGDAPALAAALGQLLDRPEHARRMGERGRQLSRGRFSWRKHAEQMLEIYRSAALGGDPARPHAGGAATDGAS